MYVRDYTSLRQSNSYRGVVPPYLRTKHALDPGMWLEWWSGYSDSAPPAPCFRYPPSVQNTRSCVKSSNAPLGARTTEGGCTPTSVDSAATTSMSLFSISPEISPVRPSLGRTPWRVLKGKSSSIHQLPVLFFHLIISLDHTLQVISCLCCCKMPRHWSLPRCIIH